MATSYTKESKPATSYTKEPKLVSTDVLLLENGGYFLLENGDFILLESSGSTQLTSYTKESKP